MWFDRLQQAHIIDASACAMGHFINQAHASENQWPGVLCALSMQAIKQGHTCLDCSDLGRQFPGLANFPDFLEQVDISALCENRLIGQGRLQAGTLFTCIAPYLFSNKFLDLELRLLRAIRSRLNDAQCPEHPSAPEQLAQLCLLKPLCFLSGGPGTGKTTTLSLSLPRWIELFQLKFGRLPTIKLCAPTGKAAARMTAALMDQKSSRSASGNSYLYPDGTLNLAITLHQLLSIHPISRQSKYRKGNSLPVDLVVVDEASMIDLPLFVQFLEAIPDEAHILIIGDAQQLPAIEAGNILDGLLNSAATDAYSKLLQKAHLHLEKNYRQLHHPGLSQFAQDCLLDDAEAITDKLSDNAYAHVIWHGAGPHVMVESMQHAISHFSKLPLCENAETALQCAKQFTILTAVRDGPYGCKAINADIARKLNPSFQALFHGQLLLITENAKHLGLANGDTAVIWRQANLPLMACFENNGRLETIAVSALPAYELAYALTIHKSQGSEYGEVAVILPEQDNPVLSKALLYTAFTRARQKLRIIASAEILRSSLMKSNKRINGLQLLKQHVME